MINWNGKIPEVIAYGTAADYCQLPSVEQTCRGVIPLDSLPASWWNAMWHDNNVALNCSRAFVNNVGQELCNIIICSGGTINENCNGQLYNTIFAVGTADKVGMVKSSTTNGQVSIASSGVMTVNGYGNAALQTTAQTVTEAINELKDRIDNFQGVTYSDTAPLVNGTAAAGTSDTAARGDHVHPIGCCIRNLAGGNYILAGDSSNILCVIGAQACNQLYASGCLGYNEIQAHGSRGCNILYADGCCGCNVIRATGCCGLNYMRADGIYGRNQIHETGSDGYNLIYADGIRGHNRILACGDDGYNQLCTTGVCGYNVMIASGNCGCNILCACGSTSYNIIQACGSVCGINCIEASQCNIIKACGTTAPGGTCICTGGAYGCNHIRTTGTRGHNYLCTAGDSAGNRLCTTGVCGYNLLYTCGCCGYNMLCTTGCCGYNLLCASGCCGYNQLVADYYTTIRTGNATRGNSYTDINVQSDSCTYLNLYAATNSVRNRDFINPSITRLGPRISLCATGSCPATAASCICSGNALLTLEIRRPTSTYEADDGTQASCDRTEQVGAMCFYGNSVHIGVGPVNVANTAACLPAWTAMQINLNQWDVHRSTVSAPNLYVHNGTVQAIHRLEDVCVLYCCTGTQSTSCYCYTLYAKYVDVNDADRIGCFSCGSCLRFFNMQRGSLWPKPGVDSWVNTGTTVLGPSSQSGTCSIEKGLFVYDAG